MVGRRGMISALGVRLDIAAPRLGLIVVRACRAPERDVTAWMNAPPTGGRLLDQAVLAHSPPRAHAGSDGRVRERDVLERVDEPQHPRAARAEPSVGLARK